MKTCLVAAVPLLWLATLGSSVGIIYLRHRASELTFELSRESARHQRLLVAFGQLEIEKSQHGAAWDGARPARATLKTPKEAAPP
jgi:cell division protein FtsL